MSLEKHLLSALDTDPLWWESSKQERPWVAGEGGSLEFEGGEVLPP